MHLLARSRSDPRHEAQLDFLLGRVDEERVRVLERLEGVGPQVLEVGARGVLAQHFLLHGVEAERLSLRLEGEAVGVPGVEVEVAVEVESRCSGVLSVCE